MTADAAATTIVWLAPEPPDAAARAALARWARDHAVSLAPPEDDAGAAPIAIDMRAGDRVEDHLDRARDALTALDGPSADHELDAAEALLRVHPELPHAAWLMAEVLRARATRFARLDPVDVEAAARASRRADGLDGGRLAGLGETPAPPADPGRAARVVVELPPETTLRVDGRDTTADFASEGGLHAVVALRSGAPVWAAWVEWPSGESTLRPDVPRATPCSAADVAPASLANGAVSASGVACARWVAAAPGSAADGLRVALCGGSRCGPIVEWAPAVAWSRTPAAPSPAERPEHLTASARWPVWATWTLMGLGAVAVAAGAVGIAAASGAFSGGAASESRFVTGGVVRSP